MSIPRFHCPQRLGPGQSLDLPPDAAHHAARVLRLETGNAIVLFNGEGGEYRATITQIGKNGVTAKTGAYHDRESESPLHVSLAQAISTGEKMDFTLQKAVELGVAHIQPLAGARSVVRLSGERAEKRVRHWRQVAVAACEQCGRNRVPAVAPILDLDDWLAGLAAGELRLILSPDAPLGLPELPPPSGPITLLVGPEGGLAPGEILAAQSRGFTPVRLGPRVLRTETAALAALAAMQALWGDF